MEFVDCVPPHLPNSTTLRVATCNFLKQQRLADHPVQATYLAKYIIPYSAYIEDNGLDKFLVHYWSTCQIYIFNKYCKSHNFSKICIDAAGHVVRKIK